MTSSIRYLDIKEICETLQLHENTVLKMLQEGELKGVKIGHSWRMLESDLPKPAVTHMEKQKVTYHCIECNAEFEDEPGSKRKFCDKCIEVKIMLGRPPKDPTQ